MWARFQYLEATVRTAPKLGGWVPPRNTIERRRRCVWAANSRGGPQGSRVWSVPRALGCGPQGTRGGPQGTRGVVRRVLGCGPQVTRAGPQVTKGGPQGTGGGPQGTSGPIGCRPRSRYCSKNGPVRPLGRKWGQYGRTGAQDDSMRCSTPLGSLPTGLWGWYLAWWG